MAPSIITGGDWTCPECGQAWMTPNRDYYECPKCGHTEPIASTIHSFRVEVVQHKVRWTCPCGEAGKWWRIEASGLLMDEWNKMHIERLGA